MSFYGTHATRENEIMKKTAVFTGALVLGAFFLWLALGADGAVTSYRFVSVEQGDVESTVSSTGTLNALTTIQVGTQVSGQVSEIFVDFNDEVTKGQLIARIDPTLLSQAVRSAEADLERSMAEWRQRQTEHDRTAELYAQQAVTKSELEVAEYTLAVANAGLSASKVGLERAQLNLAYSEIRAPIDGVVVERNVDVGQTVAASLQAPQLFLIAEDLSEMEILVAVDESDIGLICDGQDVRFTVQAYPDESFSGVVRQVRLQSSVQENVVNYTAVVDVGNDTGRLLPGMTATVDFMIQAEIDVLRVPNAALRFRATDEMTAELQKRRLEERAVTPRSATPDSAPQGADGVGNVRPAAGARGQSGAPTLLWYVEQDGGLNAIPVETGLSDGQYTVVRGPGLEESMQVIAGITQGLQTESSNPFQAQQQTQGGRPGPPGG